MKMILTPNNQTMAARHLCLAKTLLAQGTKFAISCEPYLMAPVNEK
jgi:hypothetical protein